MTVSKAAGKASETAGKTSRDSWEGLKRQLGRPQETAGKASDPPSHRLSGGMCISERMANPDAPRSIQFRGKKAIFEFPPTNWRLK